MDKIKLTNHIKDIELKNKMFRIIDMANKCLKNYEVVKSDFLNPFEIKCAKSILNSYSDIKFMDYGGYEGCERSVIFIYPFYMEFEDIKNTLSFLQIEGNFKFKEISHKDYLGSLLGLGIKREKVGDILISDNFCQVIVDCDISDFILFNLKKVSKNNVCVKEIKKEDLIKNELKYKEINTTISSKRLDCVISAVYNISRQESFKYINSERVFVDYEKITVNSKLINDKSMVSVRGKGRFIVDSACELTKKDRIKLRARIII